MFNVYYGSLMSPSVLNQASILKYANTKYKVLSLNLDQQNCLKGTAYNLGIEWLGRELPISEPEFRSHEFRLELMRLNSV